MAVESRGPGGAGGAAGATATGEPHVAPRAEREVATTAAPQTGWRPADPGPLGLAAFALTTFVLSMYNSGLVGKTSISVVLGLALFYGGATQLLAGMWEFRTGNTFGAVWLSFWALNQFYAPKIANATALGHGVGLYLLAWGLFTTYMFVASLRTTAAIAAVF